MSSMFDRSPEEEEMIKVTITGYAVLYFIGAAVLFFFAATTWSTFAFGRSIAYYATLGLLILAMGVLVAVICVYYA